jgi:tetratricopeptide (TPR) repeat protein
MDNISSRNRSTITWFVATSIVLISLAVFPSFAAADEYDDYGRSTVNSLIEGDAAAFTKSIDQKAILDTVFEGMTSDARTIAELRRGLSMGLDQIGDVMVRNLADAQLKYLRSRNKDNQHTSLVRINFGDKGINYLDLVLKKDEDGNIKIVDWYDYSKGQYYTDSVAQAIGLMLPEETTFIAKLLGTSGLKKKDVNQFIKLGELMRQQKFDEWLKLYDKLSPKLSESRVLMLTRILVTVAAGDDAAYKASLKDLHTKFGDDPTLSLILIDHYYFEEDFETAQKALDRLSDHLGGDAAIDSLRANVYLSSGDYKQSAEYAQKAIDSDPEYEDAYWTLLSASIYTEAYDTSVKMLDALAMDFGYEFYPEDIEGVEEYGDFIKSNAYKKWKDDKTSGE